MPSFALVTNAETAARNVNRYNKELSKLPPDHTFVKRIAQTQSWYALRQKDGTYLFAPCKFIGYDGLTVDDYLSWYDKSLDGRATERRLSAWAQPTLEGSKAHQEVHAALSAFCARYSATANGRARVSIFAIEEAPEDSAEAQQVDAILTLIRFLSPSAQQRLVTRLINK